MTWKYRKDFWKGEGDDCGKQERIEGRVDIIKALCRHIWKCHSETH
jgi:hypothetical protein